MMNGKISFLLLTAAVLAFACGPWKHGSDAVSTRATHTRVRAGATLESSLHVDVTHGVTFAFHVTNASDRKLEVNFHNGQTHDLVVYDSLGRRVWQWSAGRMFTQTLQNKVLHEQDTLAYEEQWTDAPRGRYRAVATLASANYPMERQTEFVVR